MLYKILKILHIDSNIMVAQAPFIFQIFFALLSDYFFHKLAQKFLGKPKALLAVIHKNPSKIH
jgi:hypothetical protein